MNYNNVINLFRDQAQAFPEGIALTSEYGQYSYGELDHNSERLSGYLQHYSGEGQELCFILSNSPVSIITSLLGVLKSGHIVVPVSYDFPDEKINQLIADLKPGWLIVDEESVERVAKMREGKTTGDCKICYCDLNGVSGSVDFPHKVPFLRAEDPCYIYFTSGSTGKPKAILGAFKGINHFINWELNYLDLPKNPKVSQFSSLSFDASLRDIFIPLCSGGTICIPPRQDGLLKLENILDWINETGVNLIHCVPTLLRELIALSNASSSFTQLKYILLSGEVLHAEDLRNWYSIYGDSVKLVNLYGPSETTMVKFAYPIDFSKDLDRLVPIGQPISETKAIILDEDLMPCKPGDTGEIFIKTPFASLGYYQDEERTKECFINHPMFKNATDVLYKTGDLGVLGSDGNFMFLGRKDQQVKIRGVRVELGEIETCIRQFSGVEDVAVLFDSEKQEISACIKTSATLEAEALAAHIGEFLPAYLLPQHYLFVDTFPRNSNGKTDRNELARQLENQTSEIGQKLVVPTNEIETTLVKIWSSLLPTDTIGIHNNFFQLGGHSLLLTRVSAAIKKNFDLEIGIKTLFSKPTIAELSKYIEQQEKGLTLPEVSRVETAKKIPLTFAQERLWFIDKLEGSVQYHMPVVLRLKNELNIELLEESLATLLERHEALRNVLKIENGKVFQELKSADDWTMKFLNLEETKEDIDLKEIITQEIHQAFDLAADYMLRATLLRRAENDHLLILVMHHIAADAWSGSILVKDLIEIHQAKLVGREVQLADLPVRYSDYAIWQRQHLSEQYLETGLSWWRKQLADTEPLNLPTDFPRPKIKTNNGARVDFEISDHLKTRLDDLAIDSGTTLFMVLLSAFKILFYRYSGQEDICIGTPVSNRHQENLEPLVGLFLNTLALRSDLSDNPRFKDLLQQLKRTCLSSFEQQYVPFEQIVDRLDVARDLSRDPVFQVLFVLHNTPEAPTLDLGGLQVSNELSSFVNAKFELTLTAKKRGNGMHFTFTYNQDIYKQSTMERMAGHFLTLLDSIVENPYQEITKLPMLGQREEKRLLKDFNNNTLLYPEGQTTVDLLAAQVRKTPRKLALVAGEDTLNYKELEERSNQVAQYLKNAGAQRGKKIAICLHRSVDMIVSMMAALKTGATYIAIDPYYPQERIDYILEDSSAEYIISSAQVKGQLKDTKALLIDVADPAIAEASTEKLNTEISSEDIAYIIYTSGSTGKPKGVMISHQSMYIFLRWSQHEFAASSFNVVLGVTSICFDLSIFEIFYTLSSGKQLHLLESALDLPKALELKDSILLNTVPSVVRSLLKNKTDLSNVTVLNMAGEPIPEAIRDQLSFEQMEVRNLYGPSEDTTYSTVYKMQKDQAILIGRPVANTQVYILDKYQNLLPQGALGELCISGEGLSKGYLDRPKLTAEKFIINPFSKKYPRLYRTGDLARWTEDGYLDFKGRVDYQVKVRGYRIELGEIEIALNALEEVRECAVLARENEDGQQNLVAYIVPKDAFEQAKMTASLKATLPAYMVPSIWVELEKMPLTANGKINRKVLPQPDMQGQIAEAYTAPRTEAEEILTNIWAQLLKQERIGIYDSFFDLGGNSLMAMRLVSAIREATGQEFEVKDLFLYPTVAGLLEHGNTKSTKTALPAFTLEPRPEKIPLSYAQERLWFVDQFNGSTPYHLPNVLRLTNDLDKVLLEEALRALIERHEILRSVYEQEDGRAYQKIIPSYSWKMTYTNAANFDEKKLDQLIAEEVSRPFDLSNDFMLRAQLLKRAANEHILVLVIHHIAYDQWSDSVLIQDLIRIYDQLAKKEKVTLEAMPLQYADYAVWQRKYLSDDVLNTKINWWEKQLEGVEPLELPTDFMRPAIQSNRGASTGLLIPKALHEKLKTLARESGASMYMTMLTIFKILLYRYSGQTDITIGTSVSNRNAKELETLLGFFINTVIVRSDLSGNPDFTDLLAQIRSTVLSAFSNQDVPFELVVDRVEKERSLSRSPVFQVLFGMQNTVESEALKLGELAIKPEGFEKETCQFDLHISLTETPEKGIWLGIGYCIDLFNEKTIEKLADNYVELLTKIVENRDQKINDYPLLAESEKQQLTTGFNNTFKDFSFDQNIVELFEAQVAKTPDAIALTFEGKEMTYEALNRAANRLASHLQSNYNIEPDDLVGMMLRRSDQAIIAILGILKIGAAFVPVDLQYPQERKQYIIEDTQTKLLIIESDHLFEIANFKVNVFAIDLQLSEDQSMDYKAAAALDRTAYVIYTSGSTGKPKGVLIQQKSLLNYIYNGFDLYGKNIERFNFPLFTSLSFDLTETSIFLSLLSGGKLIIDDGEDIDAVFARLAANPSINAIKLTPSHTNFMGEQGWDQLALAIVGGEELKKHHLEQLANANPNIRVFNEYGPTEATIGCTVYEVEDSEAPVLIGKPIGNTEIYILNEDRKLTSIGMKGEIYIGGLALAKAYWNRPELTAERFLDWELEGLSKRRIYKTGDIGRWLPDGNIEFFGRKDDQVKIRGYRIELGEIEQVLEDTPGVKTCTVIAKTDSEGVAVLVAYVVPEGTFDQAGLAAGLKSQLPDYMIPTIWVAMEKMPLTNNGKVNKKLLPDSTTAVQANKEYVAPRNECEEALALIWMDLFQLEKVSIHDEFFDLGGHSLLAVRLVAAIKEKFTLNIPLKVIFELSSIAQLGPYIQLAQNSQNDEKYKESEIFEL